MTDSPNPDNHGRLTPGEVLYGKYRINRFIGQGGFGEVYEVYDLSVNQVRAIKRLRPDRIKDAENPDRLLHGLDLEASIGAIKSPNKIQVHTAEKEGSEKFFVMEYAPNGSLAEQIETARKKGGGLNWKEVFGWAMDIANGLAELHAQQVVHRDIKPKNILLGENWEAKIADFGVAQLPGETLSISGTTQSLARQPGTREYQAPEQRDALLNRTMLPSVDIYAFGCVLFELLTGEKYFFNQGQNVKPIRRAVPGWFDELIARMTSSDLGIRPKDGKALLVELTAKKKLLEEPTIPLSKEPTTVKVAPVVKIEQAPPPRKKRSFAWLIWVATVAIVGFGAYQLITSPQTFIPSSTISSPTPLPVGTVYIEYIVDSSEGMSRPLNGSSRMELAYYGLQAHWALVPGTISTGLRVFGHRQSAAEMVKSCEDTELLSPFTNSTQLFGEKFAGLQPTGFSAAYVASLRAAMSDLTDKPVSSRAIILIAGSENLCDQNPRDLSFNYEDSGLVLPVYVISLGVNEPVKSDLQYLAEASGANLYEISTAEELTQRLNEITTLLAK